MYYRKKGNKFSNVKVTIDNIVFDSKKEARRYQELKLMESTGDIHSLVLQPKFLLQDKFIYDGKTHRKIEYIADFSYVRQADDVFVVEDVKGIKTDVFKIKEKLFIKTMIDNGLEFEYKLI